MPQGRFLLSADDFSLPLLIYIYSLMMILNVFFPMSACVIADEGTSSDMEMNNSPANISIKSAYAP